MALVRPPGHHAMREDSCGYCLLNNVALCARTAQAGGVARVLVVDWDVHHGQGTQRQFYSDPGVLYISIHRYERGAWWPNLQESDFTSVGSGPGLGYNCNIPLNTTDNTDADYLAAWHRVVLPLAAEFDPELVLVSAGYDPALGCPEGEQRVSPATFAHMTHSLRALGAPLVALLEGGYFLPSLAEGAALTLRQLLGAPCPLLPPLGACCGEMESSIQGAQRALSPYWGCFRHMAAVEVPDSVWCGPEVPETAPYDIMSPTPPRAEAEDRLYRLEVAKCIAATPLHPPPPHCLGLAPHTALQLGVQGQGGLRLGDPLALLLKREVAVALVVGGLAEVCSGLVGRVEKVLLVTCTQD